VLRVPLLFSYPSAVSAGQVLTTPVHMMDITPTILDMVEIPVPEHMQGQSLLPIIQGGQGPVSRPIYSEMPGETDPTSDPYWIAPHANLFSVKQDGWKLIHTQQAPEKDELYVVRNSSIYEQENMVSKEPGKASQLFQLLQNDLSVPVEFLFLPLLQAN